MDQTISPFISGVVNLFDPETIPLDAAQDAANFVTMDGRTVLVPGRQLLGAAGTVGATTGFHMGYKTNGDTIYFCKRGTAIMYWDGSTWQNSITGLNATDEYTFSNYASLAGAFVIVNGPSGFYKIVTSNPGSPINLYASTKNWYGYILIDRGRTILWNRSGDKTGLYGSWIDRQDSTVYTTVTGEAIGLAGSTNYTGTLAFKGGHPYANCFGVNFAATTGAGTETFTDNRDGTLTSDKGGSGTINYATGDYNITFNAVTTGDVTGGYLWEDSTVHGIADFTHSATRVAGEGFQFPQDIGGDAILNVLVGQDGAYYSLKKQSAYKLALDVSDVAATNEVYRTQMGLPFFRAAISTNKGIFFINTNNPTKPEMTILQRNVVSLSVEPVVLFPHFKFSDYVYDSASFADYDRWIMVFCRTSDSLTNNRILMCNMDAKTVDVVTYSGKMAFQDGQNVYIADSVSYSVYDAFSGFDDMGSPVNAFWTGKDNTVALRGSRNLVARSDDLKKIRRLKFRGRIDLEQTVEVYASLDDTGFYLVGTIVGSASYVNRADSQAIGGRYLGEGAVGGDAIANAYSYYMEMKIKTGKFRKITLKLVPTKIGYFDFNMMTLWDVLLFENRMPPGDRQKQKVSLDGESTNQ